MFQAIADGAGKYDDFTLMTDGEGEAVVEGYTPDPGALPPEFENLFGRFKR